MLIAAFPGVTGPQSGNDSCLPLQIQIGAEQREPNIRSPSQG